MQFKRTLNSKGLYLGFFDKKEDAEDFVDAQIRRYQFTPNPERMSIRRICREAQKKGIKLNQHTFSAELKRRNIEIRHGVRNSKAYTIRRNFTISKICDKQLQEFPTGTMSFVVNLGLKIVLGVPTEDIVLFVPEEKGDLVLIFRRNKNRIQVYISGDLDMKFQQQIRKLLLRAEEQGTYAIIQYAQQHGYRYYGGTNS